MSVTHYDDNGYFLQVVRLLWDYFFVLNNEIDTHNEIIVIMLSKATQMADSVGSNMTGSVTPSDNSTITENERNAIIKCARASSRCNSLAFRFANIDNVFFTVVS